jgi:hypothetical protein
MSNGIYVIGNRARLLCQFTDKDGAAIAPTTVTLKVRNPAGTVQTVTADSTITLGEYVGEFDLDAVGIWFYRWTGAGNVAVAAEGKLTVQASQVE